MKLVPFGDASESGGTVAATGTRFGSVLVADAPMTTVTSATARLAGDAFDPTDDLLVVTDYEENLRRIDALIREIDVRPDQVLIEATILRATLNDSNALGMEFNMVSGVDWGKLSAMTPGLTKIDTPTAVSASLSRSLSSCQRGLSSSLSAERSRMPRPCSGRKHQASLRCWRRAARSARITTADSFPFAA